MQSFSKKTPHGISPRWLTPCSISPGRRKEKPNACAGGLHDRLLKVTMQARRLRLEAQIRRQRLR